MVVLKLLSISRLLPALFAVQDRLGNLVRVNLIRSLLKSALYPISPAQLFRYPLQGNRSESPTTTWFFFVVLMVTHTF
jgi:hypothetical protein